MTVIYPTSDIIVAGEAISNAGGALTIASGDALIIGDEINIVSTTLDAIDFGLQTLNIKLDGDVAADAIGIDLDLVNSGQNLSFDYRISIGLNGSISSEGLAIFAGSSDHFSARLGNVSIVNAGQITSFEYIGVHLINALNASFSNSGSVISDQNAGIFANAVSFHGIRNAYFENTGLVKNWQGNTGDTKYVATVAFSDNTENVTATNSGLITGGKLALFSSATVSEEFANTGTINGNVQMSNTLGGVFSNSGTINGDVLLMGGDDDFDGRGGYISGSVKGGAGSDRYFVDTKSIKLVEMINGGDSDAVWSEVNWTLGSNFEELILLGNAIRGRGNEDDNLIFGNDEDNRLFGGKGIDSIFGEEGNDTIHGQRDGDRLYGGFGDDLITGNRGNDTLFGDDGDDQIMGNRGNDTLTGGQGDDRLEGGIGSDWYNFYFTNDGQDTIKDLGGSNDTLEVTGRVMSQLDFRRSGEKLIIESGGTEDSVVIEGFYNAGGKARIETLVTATSTKILRIKDTGAATDDIIVGHSGNQVIKGFGGDDILIGKGGKDRITGGAGADRFDYDDLTDSGTTSTTMDTIYDFVSGTDKIDLYDIDADEITAGNQNFSFIGAAAYSGTAGELRYQTIGGNTRIGVDVDGDMVDDFNILIAGNIAFGAGDFIL